MCGKNSCSTSVASNVCDAQKVLQTKNICGSIYEPVQDSPPEFKTVYYIQNGGFTIGAEGTITITNDSPQRTASLQVTILTGNEEPIEYSLLPGRSRTDVVHELEQIQVAAVDPSSLAPFSEFAVGSYELCLTSVRRY
ncbi:S-Ena type endospore appendage [Halobacillus salinus]|uniref:S-Ena type endospore appendage n=1 Tax=Halobacillus salinus TaxID=192814 RepID=UPI0009A88F44|nr:S-Ena type endospore appendage [Halobacillus salinus]